VAKSTTRYAALPFRRSHGRWEVLLVTTRRSGRWIVPKGRPVKGCTPARTAKIEALEEAGVTGAVSRKSIGAFEMKSRFAGPKAKASRIELFPLSVRRQHESWLEEGQRSRRWMTIRQAVNTVHPEGLGELLAAFGQELRRRRAGSTAKA
jgi:8-oxo-dGTP pyrophosphatase MutT (NUDIX family)